MIRPRRVAVGDRILAEHHNELVDAILERTPPVSVPGAAITTTPNGWSLAVRGGASRTGIPPASYRPFDPVVAFDESGNAVVKFWPGTVNGVLPENYDAEHYLGTSDVVLHWKLFITTDGKQVTAVNIASDTTPPTPPAPLENGAPEELEIGFALSKRSQVWRYRGNVSIAPVEVFRAPVATPIPWGMPYVPWYTWAIRDEQ